MMTSLNSIVHLALASIFLVQYVKGAFYFTNDVQLIAVSTDEELPVGTFLIQALTTTDRVDSFEITGNLAATYFAINKTGHITIKQRIDREAISTTRIRGKVKARSAAASPNQAENDFACEIRDINDNVPSFPQRLYKVSVSEDKSVGTVLFAESAIDNDAGLNGNLLYSIANSNETDRFSVDGSGKVRIASKLDYEKQKEHKLNITVRDQPGLSNWTVLDVSVVDADDLPAKFSAYFYSASVKEDATLGTFIVQVEAIDLDKGINGIVAYSIFQESNPSLLFAINSSTGEITLNGTLDREVKDKYTIHVLAASSYPVSDHATVSINIIDVNDNGPALTWSTYNATIDENMEPGTFVIQIHATDNDEGINAKLRYSIQDGVNSKRFNIDYQSGKISTAEKLDREDKDSYVLVVLVQDLDGNETIGVVHNVTTTVFLSVKDINDNAPYFHNSSYYTAINESLPIGSPVIKVKAKDPDIEQNIIYSISGGNNLSRFLIGQVSGVISIKTLIDRDSPKNETEFNLQVTAKDEKNVGFKSTVNVTIIVHDVNDNSPQCSQVRYVSDIKENITIGTVVASINCTDLDSGNNSRLRYHLVSGAVDKFGIYSTIGSIKTVGELDYESKSSYTIKVNVRDHGQPHHVISIFVDINIININDNAPVFTRQSYEFYLLEGDYSDHEVIVGKVTAYDNDTDVSNCPCGQIRYSIVNTTDVFAINPVTGYFKASRPFDRETKPYYTIVVKATDMDSLLPLSNTTSVVVQVIDVNDNSPVFVKSEYTVNISEANSPGFNLLKVKAIDKDAGDNANITYSIISGNIGNSFNISERTGQIRVAKGLDRETRSKYELIVAATDGGESKRRSTVLMQIQIIDADDHDPVCAQSNVIVKIKENLAPGQIITKVLITDNDKDIKEVIFYRLQSDSFAVDPNTGLVSTTRSLDREQQSEYTLVVETYYLNKMSKTANCSIRVLVEDENDNSPVFNVSGRLLSIMENATIGTTLLRVTATDDDVSFNSDLRYSLIGDGTNFYINATTGILTLIGSLDRETTPEHSLQLFSSDRGVPQSRSSSITISIKVLDVNDNMPVFSQNVYTGDVPENANYSRVLDIVASDKDEAMNAEVTYTITAGNVGNHFLITSNGSIFTASPLDRERQHRYDLTIKASDRGETAFSSTVKAIITVTDENDNAPNITNAPSEIRIQENTLLGSLIYTLMSNDNDIEVNAQVKYMGFSVPAGAFAIDQPTGAIKVNKKLDREQTQSYKFIAIASDKGSPSLNSSLTEFNIVIDDVNDNNPVFNPVSYTANVTEGLPPRSFVTIVNASEKDEGEKGRIAYKIASGDSCGCFTINISTGVISTQSELDREKADHFSLVIIAMDHGNPQRVGYAYVDVHVADINDLSPVFTQNIYFASIKENADIGSVVSQVTANDGDLGINGMISFSLVSGNGKEDFNLTIGSSPHSSSQSTSNFIGRVVTARKLDRETEQLYNITILASDGKYNATANIIIIVQDVNDNPPIFNLTGQTTNITINESIRGGTRILQVSTYDRDEGTNAKIAYTLIGEEGKFTIDDSGHLFTSSQQLDRETKDVYNLTLIATDTGNNKASLAITVHVGDSNDNVPQFNQSSYTLDVAEDYVRYYITATDDDHGTNQEMRYHIVYGSEDGLFQIDEITGNLTSSHKLDRERAGLQMDQIGRGIYLLVIEADDQGHPSLSSRVNVIVRVNDINDHKAVFQQDSYVFSVQEDALDGHILGSVIAFDKDLGVNAEIDYSIQQIGVGLKFHINSSSGVLSVNGSLDREKEPLCQITVQATDHGSPTLFSIVPVTVKIIDVNDNRPIFNQSRYSVTLPENTLPGHTVTDLHAQDADEGTNADIKYAIVNGDEGKFIISELSGVITTIAHFDHEINPFFTLNISATDPGSLQGFALVIVNVTNKNDHAPVFNKSIILVNISEDMPSNSTVTVLRTTDADSRHNGKVTYSLDSNGDDHFGIYSDSGVIFTLRPLDYENITTYRLIARATDGGPRSLSSTVQVTINVHDINDNPPRFSGYFYFHVDEDAIPGRRISSVKATDLDSGVNAKLKYSLINRNGIFYINKDNGELSLQRSLSLLSNQNISLSILCQDGGNPRLSANTTAYVFVAPGSRYRTRLIQRHSNISIYENATLGLQVTQLNASLGFVEFLRIDEDHGIFDVNSSTGEILLVGGLDREKKDTYKLLIAVRDRSERLFSDYGTVTITVRDVNDNVPTFIQKPMVSPISENSPNGTVVTQVQASDRDEGINQQVFYFIEGSASRIFSVNKENGIITIVGQLDFETNPIYNITVVAENTMSSPRLRSSMCFIVPITDVLDFMPTFARNVYNTSIFENVAPDSTIIDLNATMNDQNSRFIGYRILHSDSSNNSYHFAIDPETGVLKTQVVLDREMRSSYSLFVEARDLRDPLTYKAFTTVLITVMDVNDNYPRFINKSYTFFPKESLGVGDIIGRVQSKDIDVEENAATGYYITGGNEKGFCRINTFSGEIFLHKSLDFETISTVTLTIRADDKKMSRRSKRQVEVNPTSYDETEVTILIQDVNDNQPVFEEVLVVGTFYPQESSDQTVLAKVKATDKDSSANSVIKYIKHNETTPRVLLLNPQTGHVTLVQDHVDASVQSYSMVVTARDNNGQEPYLTASNKATVIVFQLTSNRSLTVTAGIPLSIVKQNQNMLVRILKNVTRQNVILRSLKESSDDAYSTVAVIHLIDIQARTVLGRHKAESLLSKTSNQRNQYFREWKISVYSPTDSSYLRTTYFNAYVGAMVAIAVLIGFVGLLSILVICRYKYREKYVKVYAPDEKQDPRNGTEIPSWSAVDYPQIGAYIESCADNHRFKAGPFYKSKTYQPSSREREEEGKSTVNAVSNDDLLFAEEPTVTSVLSSRYDTGTVEQQPDDGGSNNQEENSAKDNPGFEGNEETHMSEYDNTKQQSILLNPFPKKKFLMRDEISDSLEKNETPLPKTVFSPKSYSPRDHEDKLLDDKVGETMSYDVYRVHRGIIEPSVKRTRVRFDLEPTSGDELEWERQVSNSMPDILNSTSTNNYDTPDARHSNPNKMHSSPASSVSDGEQCEIWDLEDDHGFLPLHDGSVKRYDVDKVMSRNIQVEIADL